MGIRNKNQGIPSLPKQLIDSVYNAQKRVYWETDFVERCIGRKAAGIGSCNLPYESLEDEYAILDIAYDTYNKMEDCNVPYNETLDAVIDEVERLLAIDPGGTSIQRGTGLIEKATVQAIHLQMVKDQEIFYGNRRMDNPDEAAEVIKEFIGQLDRECIVVCAMDIKMHPVYMQVAGMGVISQCPVSIPDIFKAALLSNASSLILAHNHLSGDVSPSKADFLVTEQVKKAGEILGVQLQDHIILGDEGHFYSFREETGYWD